MRSRLQAGERGFATEVQFGVREFARGVTAIVRGDRDGEPRHSAAQASVRWVVDV